MSSGTKIITVGIKMRYQREEKNNCQFLIIGFVKDGEKGIQENFQVRITKRTGFVHLRKIRKSREEER